MKGKKVYFAVIGLLVCSNLYFLAAHWKYKSLYQWHHIRYHELRKLVEYRDKYSIGSSKKIIIKQEKDYKEGHSWCRGDVNKLCVEPHLSDWKTTHYCGFTFHFKREKLAKIESNSPCH